MTIDHPVIVLGASAGGIEALKQVVADLPANFPGAILIVLHMAPQGLNVLDQILGKAGQLPAKIAESGESIKPGWIYVAPTDHHLLVDHAGRLVTTHGPMEKGSRPAIDPLFRSAAEVFGPRAIGVILTGYLDDGTSGLRAIRSHGGITVVQNPEEAIAPSMPTSAIKQVEIHHIVHLAEIGGLLVRLTRPAAPLHG